MAFFMIRQEFWNALSVADQERVRRADSILIGEMPTWIDTRDESLWFVGYHPAADFEKNMQVINELAPNAPGAPAARVLEGPPDWAREATEDELTGRPGSLDRGVLLLEPVEVREYAAIDKLLKQLWQLIEAEELSPEHSIQIQAMARLLRDESLDVVPGKTERWKVVGLVRTILRPVFLVAGGMVDAIAIVEIVDEIGWSELARELMELLS